MRTSNAAWLTATDVLDAIRSRELSPSEVVGGHLERIERFNPTVAAYIHVDRRAAPGEGPLAGVTVAVKDTQPVRGMPWTYGSRKWQDRVAGEDGIAVAHARRQGVALLGKTNTPELAASVGTVNELFPPTQNPWRRGYTPGGSSGGSGAAVASGLCSLAYGDDMGGSVRIPSSCCGVVGLRPSTGRIPVLDPDPTRLSVPGPLARSVADLRLALALMTGEIAPGRLPAPRGGVRHQPARGRRALPGRLPARGRLPGRRRPPGGAHRLGPEGGGGGLSGDPPGERRHHAGRAGGLRAGGGPPDRDRQGHAAAGLPRRPDRRPAGGRPAAGAAAGPRRDPDPDAGAAADADL